MPFKLLLFELGPWASEPVHKPFKSGFFHSLEPCGSPGNKSHWFSRSDALRTHLSSAVPKGWGAHGGTQTLCFSRTSSVLWHPSNWGLSCLGWGFLQDHVLHLFYLSPCGPLILCGRYAIQVVFRSFSQGIIPCVTVDLLCSWEEVSSESFSAAILNPPPLFSFI